MSSAARDLATMRRMGTEALVEKFGPVGMVEFIRLSPIQRIQRGTGKLKLLLSPSLIKLPF